MSRALLLGEHDRSRPALVPIFSRKTQQKPGRSAGLLPNRWRCAATGSMPPRSRLL